MIVVHHSKDETCPLTHHKLWLGIVYSLMCSCTTTFYVNYELSIFCNASKELAVTVHFELQIVITLYNILLMNCLQII